MKLKNLTPQEAESQRQEERRDFWPDPCRVRFLRSFRDGGLDEQFSAIDQDPRVQKFEIRTLPKNLLIRILQSAGLDVLEIVYRE